MTQVLKADNWVLSQFEQFEREQTPGDPPFLRRLRQAAIARYDELGLPTPRNEDWKFTNTAALSRTNFQHAKPVLDDGAISRLIGGLGYQDSKAITIVLVNGEPVQNRNLEQVPKGAVVSDLWSAISDHTKQVEPHLGRHVKFDELAFAALNTAFVKDGAFVYVPRGMTVERPIHLVNVSTAHGEPAVSYPRNLIVVGENSRVTLVESYFGPDGETYFTNAVTEVVVGANAAVDHYKLQREGRNAYHVATTQVVQARDSRFSSHYMSLGGNLVRNEVHVRFDGQGGEATVNGLYLAGGRQHMDNHTVIDHAQPHCDSHELYKGILDDQAHGVFNGKILVRQDAQKTDAKQTNQTLLLSEDAVINTKPQLEIYADDVKCTHGATVGQLNEDAIFYLRARGIGLEEARRLLTFAFANDIVTRIQIPSLQKHLEEVILQTPLVVGKNSA